MLIWRNKKPEEKTEAEQIGGPDPTSETAVVEDQPEVVMPEIDLSGKREQQNIKTTADCKMAFAALARALKLSKSDLFEDLVAARLEELQRQGVEVEV